MDKEKLVCRALLNTLTSLTLTPSEFKVLLALRVHGELRMSELKERARFNTIPQYLMTKLTAKRMVDKLPHLADQTRNNGSRKVHKYSINPNGLIALKQAISPTLK